MLSARDRACSRCTTFWFPEPHLRAGFLWWEWQSVPSLQELHLRCSICIHKIASLMISPHKNVKLEVIHTQIHTFSRCRSPAEWNLVPWPLAVLAFSDSNLHLLLQTDDHPPRSAWVAVCIHPLRSQPSGQGSKVSSHSVRGPVLCFKWHLQNFKLV